MIVRHGELSDLAGIKAIYEQPHAYGNTLQLPYQSDGFWQRRLQNSSDSQISLVAVHNDEIVGQISLSVNDRPRRKHVATLGMGVSHAHRGTGVGSKLLHAALDLTDNWLNVTRVEIEVYTDNEQAINLYQKFGFEVEGTAKNYAFRQGRYVDALYMARLSSAKL
ncbi:GNAT family N-acetyltransferase [Simiduia aestuariiviva]|uniref:Putative acetyltransferase n=1 Tax=Simiduia aestuariiviva TaxID=1510459 RepID=A0A839UJT6_9GAMM|nr:GNAT family N-acetyltransferase [Simiduia aestuariiviva]MBB3167031.1 putative acetyltransferase [Simiduia aestuariiviva]